MQGDQQPDMNDKTKDNTQFQEDRRGFFRALAMGSGLGGLLGASIDLNNKRRSGKPLVPDAETVNTASWGSILGTIHTPAIYRMLERRKQSDSNGGTREQDKTPPDKGQAR